VDERVAEPIARIRRRQIEHRFDAFGIARQRLLPLGAHHVVAPVFGRRALREHAVERKRGRTRRDHRGLQKMTTCQPIIDFGHTFPLTIGVFPAAFSLPFYPAFLETDRVRSAEELEGRRRWIARADVRAL
jgi:hypothetical protein